MSVRTEKVGREIIIKEVAPKRRAVRGLGGGAGTDSQDLVRARKVRFEVGLECLGVGVCLSWFGIFSMTVTYQVCAGSGFWLLLGA